MSKTILLFGPTCSGKSTLGRLLESTLGITYYSFGDLKRKAINAQTILGQRIAAAIKIGEPIKPEDGRKLILDNYCQEPLICICGYPISKSELECFQEIFTIVLVVDMQASLEIIRSRYFYRAVCPICGYLGKLGFSCPIHQKEMVRREATSERELQVRIQLYEKRINPFVQELINSGKYDSLNYWAEDNQQGLITEIKRKIGGYNGKPNSKNNSSNSFENYW